MAKRLLDKQGSTSGGRLRRGKEQPERTGQPTELPIENLIVIGASAGGHDALWAVVRERSHDVPAAVIIMQHMAPRDSFELDSFRLDAWLRYATHVPVVQIHSMERLRSSVIYICPSGMSVSLKGRTLHLMPQER